MKPYLEKQPSNRLDKLEKPNIVKTYTIKDEDKKISKITPLDHLNNSMKESHKRQNSLNSMGDQSIEEENEVQTKK